LCILFSGENGVVDEGLRHLAIPKGWSWGGKATTRGPLWSTLYDLANDECPTIVTSTEHTDITNTAEYEEKSLEKITESQIPVITVTK